MTDLAPAPDGYAIKLVRDKTPRIINETGKPGELFYALIPDDEERLEWLKKKLAEEVTEYLLKGSSTEGFDELADVLAVVLSLAQWHGGSWHTILRTASEDPRGLFNSGVMMYGRHPEFDK